MQIQDQVAVYVAVVNVGKARTKHQKVQKLNILVARYHRAVFYSLWSELDWVTNEVSQLYKK